MESSTPLAENFERNRSNPPPKRYHHKRRRYEINMLYIYILLLYIVATKPYSLAHFVSSSSTSTKMTTNEQIIAEKLSIYIQRTVAGVTYFLLHIDIDRYR